MRRLLPLLLFFVALGCASEEGGLVPVGSTAPDFKLETLSVPSSSVSLAKRKGKVVLLDYWATWCGPCRQITPTLEAIYERHKGEGLEAMAITDEAREIVTTVEKSRPHTMPVLLDSKGEAHDRLGIEALPTIIVVDRKGHIAFRSTGFSDPKAFGEEVEAAIEKALKE